MHIAAQVRRKLIGESQPNYSQYTCYTGISDFTPPDIDTVGYITCFEWSGTDPRAI